MSSYARAVSVARIGIVSVLAFVLAGCIESTTLVTVNGNGSGTITLYEYLSPELSGMMNGMGDMVGQIGDAMQQPGQQGGAAAKPAEKVDMFAQGAKDKAQKFGEGVKLVDYAKRTSKNGWQGYRATYAFNDVRKLTVTIGDNETQDGSGGTTKTKGDSRYTFKFTPGDTASLEIVPMKDPAPAAPAAGGAAEVAAEAPDMGGEMMGMMAPMLKGMRLSFLVQVEGAIKETNSKYRSEKNPNVVTIMDVPMDRVLSNPAALKLMSSKKPEDREKMAAMNIPGVRMESLEKTITVKFK